VRTDDTLDGALVVYAAEPRAFDDDVPAALLDLAATLGFGLARLRDQHEREALLVRSEAEAGRLRATLDSLFDPLALLEVVRTAGAPVICETAEDGRKDDIAWLRERV